MNWSDAAWRQSEGIYQQILGMPFIKELIDGTLPVEKFRFYIQQDAFYLEHFARALAIIGAKAQPIEYALDFIGFAQGAIIVERSLHAGYFDKFGVDAQAQISPACHYYASFLLSTAALQSVEVAMAAVLPCFWIYKKVGDHIYRQQQGSANPYKEWIDTYAGQEFEKLVDKAISICDTVVQQTTSTQQEAMTQAFMTACRLEWLFWDSAWRLEKWQI